MKIAVVGSRTFNNYELLAVELDKLKPTVIVSGGAKGADSLAEQYAAKNGIPVEIYKPDWGKYNKSAGMVRNVDIINAAEHVVAFWDGVSAGTKHSVGLAKSKGLPLTLITF